MNCFSQEQLNKIFNLVREVEKLNDIERLLLYLQLPCGRTELPEGKYKTNSSGIGVTSSSSSSCSASSSAAGSGCGGANNVNNNHKQSQDIFSKKSDQETTQTYTWILSHLEEDPNVSLPKQEVYDDYRAFCQANKFEPLCVADFGKAMKHALPCIKPRRLGQRGNSRYCYSGLRKKYKIEAPSLPDLTTINEPPSPQPTQVQSVSRPSLGGGGSCSSGPAPTEQYYASGRVSRESTRLAKIQCRNSGNPYDYSQQASTIAATAVSPPVTGANQQQLQQARSGRHDGATNSTAATFMNLKLESSCNTNQNQSHCSAVTSPASSILLDCCNPSANSRVNLPFNSDNNSANGNRGAVQSASTSGAYHHNMTQLDSHSVVQQPQMIRCEQARHYSQPSFVHRSGTPDDDDYRHNYHDLNRPIIGPAIIPFSQSLTAQLAQQTAPNNGFISYNNHPHPLPLPPPPPPPPQQPSIVNHLPQQDQQHQPLHQHQHQQAHPHELSSMGKIVRASNTSETSGQQVPAGVGQHQQSVITTNSCCQETNGSNARTIIKSAANNLHLGSNNNGNGGNNHQQHQHQHQQRHNIDDEHHYEMSGRDNNNSDGNNNNNNGDRTDCEQTIELPTHNSSDPQHINWGLFNHCSGSPFQSPASTPYPNMSNYPTAQDGTQDYYAGECISYPDQ